MTATITIRPFETDDQPAVLELLRQALGEAALRRTTALFTWKHVNNPFGRSIMFVAEDPQGIVGFRAFMRWELATVDDQRLRCVRAVDTATHPRARRQGVFKRLTLEAINAARAEGVDLIFNTPNARSGAGYLSMGWTEVGPIGTLVRPRSPRSWRRSDAPAEVTIGTPWRDQAVVDRQPRGLRTPRTPEYLRWRFGAHPSADYRVVANRGGMAVVRPNLRRERRELVVSEIFGSGAGSAIRMAARNTDAAYLVGWFSSRSPERAAAIGAGLLPVPGVTALTLFARPLRQLATDVTQLNRWDLSLGDLELL